MVRSEVQGAVKVQKADKRSKSSVEPESWQEVRKQWRPRRLTRGEVREQWTPRRLRIGPEDVKTQKADKRSGSSEDQGERANKHRSDDRSPWTNMKTKGYCPMQRWQQDVMHEWRPDREMFLSRKVMARDPESLWRTTMDDDTCPSGRRSRDACKQRGGSRGTDEGSWTNMKNRGCWPTQTEDKNTYRSENLVVPIVHVRDHVSEHEHHDVLNNTDDLVM